MVSIKAFIQDLDISEGESLRQDCPFCRGQNSFSVSKVEGVLKYNCFKERCKIKGNIEEGLSHQEIKKRIKNRKESNESMSWEDTSHRKSPMLMPEYIVPIEGNTLNGFIQRWDLQNVELLHDVKDNRVVFPIRKDGIIIDATGRTLNYAKPKWLRYTGEADVYVACQGEPNGIAVIVEDVISANTICSVCQNVTGIAILGTSMSVKHIEYIQDYTKIIMALDPDASNKNLQYRREIVSWTGINTIAMRLKNDIKYKEEEDISLLKTLCNLSG
jgi:hypothetical protein